MEFTLTVTRTHLHTTIHAISNAITGLAESCLTWPERAALASLESWIKSADILKKLVSPFEGEKHIKLKKSIACALAWIITQMELDPMSYLGNYLTRVSFQIHQFYGV